MKKRFTRRDILTIGAAGAAGATGAAGAASSFGRLAFGPTAAFAAGKDSALPQVPRKILGKTGEAIPILLFGGAMRLDPRFDPKLAEAMRFGVDYFDAADCYGGGSCEPAVGAFHTRAKIRDKIWITSKSDAHDPKGFEKTVNESLQKLKTSYINLYFLHALENADFLNKDLEKVVARLKKEGKIRHFGFSCHNANVPELLEKAAVTPWVESVMFRYNFRQYGDKALNKAMDAAHKADVGLIAMKTQGSEASFADAWKKFEKTGKWNKFQAVLKAVWADPRITAAVSHMDNFKKLKENIAAAVDKTELGALDRRAIEKYAAETRSLACDGCDHLCREAVGGAIPVGTVMRYVMYHEAYGEVDEARALFAKLPAETRSRLKVLNFERANDACPHGVNVAEHLARAQALLA
ncbi:MAG: aldo/keto reductase [Deltaproteobacteria bacterium]|nr:aldo/keto reductase [Deltaproteobacteria bacterium]